MDLIIKAMAASNGAVFTSLWKGDTSAHGGDDSAADMALCNHLAFWTGNDPYRIDTLFRQSGLYREKWERQDYRDRTIERAIENTRESYRECGNVHRQYKSDTDQPTTESCYYLKTDSKGNQSLDLALLATDILKENAFATMDDTDEILVYRDGYYQANGARYIKAQCQAKVGITPLLSEHKVSEVIGHVTRSTYVSRALFNTSKYVLNLKNGLYDVKTHKLSEHTPGYLSTIRIPINYDPKADCPAIKNFIQQIHRPEDISTIQEVFGYVLIPDNTIQKAILFVGQGGEGKSTELNVMKAEVGPENCSNVSWQKLELNRFAASTLEGKLVNIFADLPAQSLSTTTSFKMLTGGDSIGAEKKFKDGYSFNNFARLLFSTNKPPKIYDDDSFAFWRRWVIIEFPNQVPDERQDKHLIDKLTTDTELSGLLNWALEGLERLLNQQGYSYKKSVEETTEYYLRAADPVYAFLIDVCEVDSQGCVTKDELYEAFLSYAKEKHIPSLRPNAFARALTNQTTVRVRSTRPTIEGKRVTSWEGLKLTESVKDVKDVKANSPIKPIAPAPDENNINKGKNIDNPDNLDQNTVPDPPDYSEDDKCPECGELLVLNAECTSYICQECNKGGKG